MPVLQPWRKFACGTNWRKLSLEPWRNEDGVNATVGVDPSVCLRTRPVRTRLPDPRRQSPVGRGSPVSVEGWDRLGQVDLWRVLVEPRLSCEVLLPVVLLSLHHHPRVRHRLRKRGPVSSGDLGPVRGLALGPPARGRLGRVADPVLQVVLEGRVGRRASGTSTVATLIVMAALLSQLHRGLRQAAPPPVAHALS